MVQLETYKSMVLEKPRTVSLVEKNFDKLKKDEVLIAVKACALCGSDLHAFNGHHSRVHPPRVLGHEISGQIVEIGKNVEPSLIDMRCCIENHIPCGQCVYCSNDKPNLCINAESIGFTKDGGYSEFLIAPADCIVPLPEKVSYPIGSIMQTMGVSYHAVKDIADVVQEDKIGIIGAGPIGLCALSVAKSLGSFVIHFDVVDYRLSAAKELGADIVVNLNESDPVEISKEYTNGLGLDKIIEAAGGSQDKTLQLATQLLRKSGEITVVGTFSDNQKTIRIVEFKDQEMVLKGSRGHPHAFEPCLELVESGKISLESMLTHHIALKEVQRALLMMEKKADNVIKVVIDPTL